MLTLKIYLLKLHVDALLKEESREEKNKFSIKKNQNQHFREKFYFTMSSFNVFKKSKVNL